LPTSSAFCPHFTERFAVPEHDPTNTSVQSAVAGYIDAHVHVWTTDFERYPLATEFTPSQMIPARFTPEDLLASSKPLGVNRTVLVQMVFYGNDNSYMLDCIEQHPGVFSGIALVDEHGSNPAREMCRLKQFHVRGVRIVPPQRGAANWIDGPGMHAMWGAAADEGLAMCVLIDADDLPAINRMCGRFPNTRVVVDHCARIGRDGQFRPSDVQQLCRLAIHPHVYVKASAFYFLGAKQPPYTDVLPLIRQLVEAFGPQRLMWATDCPFQVMAPHTYLASLELVRDRLDVVSPTDREWILGRTAETLFFN
jgi:predicted TIM-barrel fold metal-dependent hydrolase